MDVLVEAVDLAEAMDVCVVLGVKLPLAIVSVAAPARENENVRHSVPSLHEGPSRHVVRHLVYGAMKRQET